MHAASLAVILEQMALRAVQSGCSGRHCPERVTIVSDLASCCSCSIEIMLRRKHQGICSDQLSYYSLRRLLVLLLLSPTTIDF